MKTLDRVQDKIEIWQERINDYLLRLTLRERIMVIVASIVVVVASIGASIWKMHSSAEFQQQRLAELKDNLVWMQNNVVTMKTTDDLSLTAIEKIQRTSQQQGLSVASQQVGEKIQIVAEHQNYSILANFLTQLSQMGLSIEKLELNKVEQQIKLTATIH